MRIVLFLLFTICFTSRIIGGNDEKDGIKSEGIKENNTGFSFISVYNSLDSLYDSVNIWWKTERKSDDSLYNIRIPDYPVYIYEKRIDDLNERTPIKLEYNEHVKKYIEAYGVKNTKKMQLIIARSSYYFPIFEEYLDKYDLPLELKYLAAVESALDPNAVSRSGATGLWQFMKPTADIFGLKVNSYIDERRDIHKSTEAACKYLRHLFQTFGDWQLALAAYNGGPGTLTKAIARSGGKINYWDLRPYLTDQMQNYVPAFIAMNYLMNYHSEHNIFPDAFFIEAIKTDSIVVEGPLNIKNISESLGIDHDLLLALNPMFRHGFIPNDGNKYSLVLPGNEMHEFIEKYELIKNSESNSVDSLEIIYEDIKPERNGLIYYKIVRGDNLFRLAIAYNCTVNEILEWNNLNESYIPKVGDNLKIFIEQK